MRAKQFIREYTDLETAKKEIINSISQIDPNTKDEDAKKQAEQVLDKIYTVLNKNKVLDRFTSVLPSVLKGEFPDTEVMKIAGEIAKAPLTYAEKMKFTENLATNKVIDPKVLVTPGIHTIDDLCFGSPANKEVFLHLRSYGVGKMMKGPMEHALAILSATITIKGKGDVTVGNTAVEVKAAIGEKKGSGGGRFGETGKVPSRDRMVELLYNDPKFKGPAQDYLENKQGSMNIETFTKLANEVYRDDPAGKKKFGETVFKEIFQSHGQAVANEFAKSNADPNAVRLAYIKANFDWYKNSEQGGAWKVLCGISMADNAVGVMINGDDYNNVPSAKTTPYIITSGKPQEMLAQFTPKLG